MAYLVVADLSWQERWERMDPMLVLERKQEREARSRQGKRGKAKAGLEALFEGEGDMARRLGIPPHIESALYQWGKWANRPQFWQNLNATPFYKLMGIGSGRPMSDIRLDPQSLKIHKTMHRMRCGVTKKVLVCHYVADENWDSKELVFKECGISRRAYYEALRTGSVALYNASKL